MRGLTELTLSPTPFGLDPQTSLEQMSNFSGLIRRNQEDMSVRICWGSKSMRVRVYLQPRGQLFQPAARPCRYVRLGQSNATGAAVKGTTGLWSVCACVQHASSPLMFSLKCDPWFQFLSSSWPPYVKGPHRSTESLSNGLHRCHFPGTIPPVCVRVCVCPCLSPCKQTLSSAHFPQYVSPLSGNNERCWVRNGEGRKKWKNCGKWHGGRKGNT